MRKAYIAAMLVASSAVTAAEAHPKLLSASPAANSAVAAPGKIEMHFSEGLIPAFASIDLVEKKTSAKVAVKTNVSGGGKTLTGVPARPLTPGAYHLTYRVTSVDTHRIQASYDFTVR
ncbi:copper homeostasis periplasmic binding protein CopC [Sphingomonas sp. MMS24-J13]|uniref:copper homeostasis periplasmic binding protein CopC n=1 Tax=Sphingomonas sp. MMS24-J13 TaxID=3238686 RepID=UPI00384C1B66